ncbi:hypothetical protein Droror1_Dr00027627, partial [Drosera rotundifolia]
TILCLCQIVHAVETAKKTHLMNGGLSCIFYFIFYLHRLTFGYKVILPKLMVAADVPSVLEVQNTTFKLIVSLSKESARFEEFLGKTSDMLTKVLMMNN